MPEIIKESLKEETIQITPEAHDVSKQKIKASNRFKIDRLQVSSELDGVVLASFSQRLFAFLIDIGILFTITLFWWVGLLVFLVMKITRKKLKKSLRKLDTNINLQLRSIDQKLQQYEVEQKMRERFKKHLNIYMYILMYVPVVVALIYLGSLVSGLFVQTQDTNTLKGWVDVLNNTLNPLNFLIGGFFSVLYFGTMNYWFQGQTLGKKLIKIRVVKLNGKPMTFWGSIERATGYTASGSLFLYGFFQFFWDPNRQTTHDKITETIVIRK